MSDNRDAVAHVAMYALLGKALKDQENQGRSYLVDSMEVGDAVVGRANGLPVGRAVKSVRTDAKVVDDKALLKWVKANHPDEVETVEQVRPAFLAQLKKAGELLRRRYPAHHPGRGQPVRDRETDRAHRAGDPGAIGPREVLTRRPRRLGCCRD